MFVFEIFRKFFWRSTVPLTQLLVIFCTAQIVFGQGEIREGIQYVISTANGATECVDMTPQEAEILLGVPVTGRAFFREGEAKPRMSLGTANFEVDLTGFSPEAAAAFQHAVDIWATLIVSPVTIRVEASWDPLPSGVLGGAGPTSLLRDFSGAPVPATWYNGALADKLAGTDLSPGGSDISAVFNSNFTDWYFGTDSNPGPGEFDFVTVVLHELGHGLGITDSFDVVSGEGSWGLSGFPIIYDQFTETGSGISLLETGTFPNPSTGLGDALQSNDVFFGGVDAQDVRLYAPGVYQAGSSIAHLNEATFPAGNPDSLMTPSVSNGEAIHTLGSTTLALFSDMGWVTNETMTSGCNFLCDVGIGTETPVAPLTVERSDSTGRVILVRHNGAEAIRNMMDLSNNGIPQFRLIDHSPDGDAWQFSNTNHNLNISLQGSGSQEFLIQNDGDVFIGNGTIQVTSTREKKENFVPVKPNEILGRIAQLDISEWNYRKDPETVRHIGPVSEDFYRLFGVGEGDEHLSPTDLSGVALAAIQGLLEQNEKLIREVQELREEVKELKRTTGSQRATTSTED